MKPILRNVCLLLALCTLTTSCYFTSKHGLPKSLEMDQTLLGMWETIPQESEKSKEKGYLLFLEDDEGSIHIVAWEGNYRYTETYRGFISEVKGNNYLNVKEIRVKTPTTEDYFIVGYEIKNKDSLEIALLNEDAMEKAIQDKKVKGVVKKGKYTSEVALTASPEELARFFGAQKQANILDKKHLVRAKKIYTLPKQNKQ
jgi:hypothetical protein